MANHDLTLQHAADAAPNAPPATTAGAMLELAIAQHEVTALADSIIAQAMDDLAKIQAEMLNDGDANDPVIIQALRDAIAFARDVKTGISERPSQPVSRQTMQTLQSVKGKVQEITNRLEAEDESARQRREAISDLAEKLMKALDEAKEKKKAEANIVIRVSVPAVALVALPEPTAVLSGEVRAIGRELAGARVMVDEAFDVAKLKFDRAVETAQREGKIVVARMGEGASALVDDRRNDARDAARYTGTSISHGVEALVGAPAVAAAIGEGATAILDVGVSAAQKTHTVINRGTSMNWFDAYARNHFTMVDGAADWLGISAFSNALRPLLNGVNNDRENDWKHMVGENGERLLDIDGDGQISMGELRKVLVNNRVTLDVLDADHNGSISLGELTAQLAIIKGKNKARVRGVN